MDIYYGVESYRGHIKNYLSVLSICADSVEMSTSGDHVKNGLSALLIYVGIPYSCIPQGSLSNLTLFSKTFSNST